MKNLFFCISAMFLFLAGVMPVSGQSPWPEFDPGSNDPLRATIDDGFGGKWTLHDDIGSIFMWRPEESRRLYPQDTVRQIPILSSNPNPTNAKLKFDKRSLPPKAGINLAFYGYLKKLNKKNSRLTVLLWVDPNTGEVNEVMFFLHVSRGNKTILSVPPRCFTLYEDILKKTVKFQKPAQGIFDQHDSICYTLYIEKFPAPAEGEPDFLALPAAAE